eukprot:TRINITY_DN12334_c0_g1_i1.p1 TRINITY_DN12334_c0_g1~~TRINITY_DN12334_c0_g1_i1.p1  ORF type:complete len:764 (-),score=119.85 TRINITY_DN12334_c0_g1_i1:89-2380(-)
MKKANVVVLLLAFVVLFIVLVSSFGLAAYVFWNMEFSRQGENADYEVTPDGLYMPPQSDKRDGFFLQFQKVETKGPEPEGRTASAEATYFSGGKKRLLSFGGKSRIDRTGSEVMQFGVKLYKFDLVSGSFDVAAQSATEVLPDMLNDTIIYDFDTETWETFVTTGVPMIPRHSGSLVVGGIHAYLYGGSPNLNVILNNGENEGRNISCPLATFNLETHEWQCPEVDLLWRFGHCAVEKDGEMFVYGGTWDIPRSPGDDGKVTYPPTSYDDFFAVDLNTFAVRNVSVNSPEKSPGKRFFHKCLRDGDKMYLFGGLNKNFGTQDVTLDAVLVDMWAFDFQTSEWELLNDDGFEQAQRIFFGMDFDVDKKYILVAGGIHQGLMYKNDIHKFFLANNTWLEIPISYPGPTPKWGQSVFSGYSAEEFLIFNGRAEKRAVGGYLTDLDTRSVGRLFAGELPDPPKMDPIAIGSPQKGANTQTIIFENSSPNVQQITPVDNCAKSDDSQKIDVIFRSLEERNPLSGSTVQKVNMNKGIFAALVQSSSPFQGVDFSLQNFAAANLSMGFDFKLFNKSVEALYAGGNFEIKKGTNKLSLNITSWSFKDPSHVLVAFLEFYPPIGDLWDKDIRTDEILSENRREFTVISLSTRLEAKIHASLAAIVDIDYIEPLAAANLTVSEDQTVATLALGFKAFNNSLLYDPEYAVLLEGRDESCGDGNNEAGIFAGVAVGICVLATCALLLIVGIVIAISQRKRIKQMRSMGGLADNGL